MKKHGETVTPWKGKIENKIFLGCTVRYEVRTESGDSIIVRRPLSANGMKWKVGDCVDLVFSPHSILLYPYPEEGVEKAISVE
jgi:hypothetical protein